MLKWTFRGAGWRPWFRLVKFSDVILWSWHTTQCPGQNGEGGLNPLQRTYFSCRCEARGGRGETRLES